MQTSHLVNRSQQDHDSRTVCLRLLLVEKSQSEADVLVNMLLYAGYRVASKRIGGIRELETVLPMDHWDLVLCDCALLNESPVRMVEVIRGFSSTLPVISVFDEKNETLFAELHRSGVNDCVPKSNMARLVIAVERERVKQAVTLDDKTFSVFQKDVRFAFPSMRKQLRVRNPFRKK